MNTPIIVKDRIIMHVDFDSFFASCEQEFNLELRNKPVGITAENGRTCIIAASREAKLFGIKTGTRSWEAKKILPSITLIPARFEKYYEISKKFLSLCSTYSPFVEVFSIDEVFLDLTPTLHLYKGSYEIVAKDLKEKIKKEFGSIITVSIGISYNKLLAKLASGLNKPNGFYVINKENLDSVYNKTCLLDVCGIGVKTGEKLNKLNIFDLFTLRSIPEQKLTAEFGKAKTKELKSIAWGKDKSEVANINLKINPKSLGRQYCLPKNEYDQEKILKIVAELCSEISISLRKLNKKTRTIGLHLAGEISRGGQKTIDRHTNLEQEIFSICLLLYKTWNWKYMVRRISVWTSNLENENKVNLSLFDNLKLESLAKTVDKINEKFGDHTIRNGFLLDAIKLTNKPNGYSR